MASLLPKERTDFADKSYWNDFNAKTSEFEWYGSFKQLQATLEPYLRPGASVLVVGCGNSAFSAELYDAGITSNVANMDYDEGVIKTMAERNKSRPQMTWKTDDMRYLSTFKDASFDVIIDKGALDALMSSPEAKPDAVAMMESISRKLKPGGCYLCITLSQTFVFDVLSETLKLHYDSGEIKILKGAADGEPPAAVCQFEVCFDAKATDTSPFKERVLDEQCRQLLLGAQASFSQARAREEQGTLHPGRVLQIDLWGQGKEAKKTPRYSIAIVDTSGGDQPMACFIVPQGREHEYLFSSEDGLKQIAFSASCSRLLSITLNRGHKFENMEAVQGELSKYVVDFAPNGSTQAQIPFMTTAESLGSRDVIAEGTLESSGAFHVEESSLESGVVRRLIFAANTNVIQTEVRLVAKSNQPAKKNKGGGGKKTSGKKKGNKGKGGNSAAGDGDYLAMVPDPTYLCFDYHRAMLAALSLLPAASLKDSTGVIVGLGGGALPMAMQSFAPTMALTCLELDAEVVKVASKFFGFREDSKVSVAVADGLAYDYGTNTHGLICLDVDSKDVSLGISCPPPAFLEASFLSKVKSALLEDGILVVNLSARSSELLKGALDAIKGAFSNGRVFTIMPSEDDVNLIVIAVNGMSVALPKVQATASVAEAQKKRAGDTSSLSGVLRSRVREWLLEVPDMRTDPMGLMELAEALKEITANLV